MNNIDFENINTEEDLNNILKKKEIIENQNLEFKSKPNQLEVKEIHKCIDECFINNIKKAVCAFANSYGGHILVGINDKKHLSGLDDQEVNKVTKEIRTLGLDHIIRHKRPIKLKNERSIIIISVKKRNPFDPPIFLKGAIYKRVEENSQRITNIDDLEKFYAREQFYIFYAEGMRKNIEKLDVNKSVYDISNFISGLEDHINNLLKENFISLESRNNLLDKIVKIRQYFNKKLKKPNTEPLESLKKLTDDYVNNYKSALNIKKG